MAKYLVTGSSGFLGSHLCPYLSRKGIGVHGVDLETPPKPVKGMKFTQGDIRDAQLMARLAKGMDAVIHLAARDYSHSPEEIHSTNVTGTRNVLDAAVKNKVKRFIFTSTTEVYGFPDSLPIRENFPLKAYDAYTRSKVLAETLCVGYRGRGTAVGILRPTTFAGPGRKGPYERLCRMVSEKKSIPVIGKGKVPYQVMHVSDIVEAIYLLSKAKKEVIEDTYNISSEHRHTLGEALAALQKHAGHGRGLRHVPAIIAMPGFGFLRILGKSPMHRWGYMSAVKGHAVSTEKIRKSLKWTPKKSTVDALIDTYEWHLRR